ncbi:uncharacterized protein LOC131951062 [Physella acuta]|uniref:uncharacterized protein LOC131951062 n=1 Tax=Physella acuta TaxID=109671 RepID=UPI0027DBE1EC|nr:uncharacterized protein LOC131951062 [Physella acuta]
MEYIFTMPPLPQETDAMFIFHTTHTIQFPVTANFGQTSFLLQFNKPQQVAINIPLTPGDTEKGAVMEFFASNDFQINVYMVFGEKTFEVFLPVPLELWTSVYFAFTVQDSGASISVVTKESNWVNIIFYTQKGRLRFGGQEIQDGEEKEVFLLEYALT